MLFLPFSLFYLTKISKSVVVFFGNDGPKVDFASSSPPEELVLVHKLTRNSAYHVSRVCMHNY